MKELMIYTFQAKHIENALRIVANILGNRKKQTCADRQICKSIEMIKEVLGESVDAGVPAYLVTDEQVKNEIEKIKPNLSPDPFTYYGMGFRACRQWLFNLIDSLIQKERYKMIEFAQWTCNVKKCNYYPVYDRSTGDFVAWHNRNDAADQKSTDQLLVIFENYVQQQN